MNVFGGHLQDSFSTISRIMCDAREICSATKNRRDGQRPTKRAEIWCGARDFASWLADAAGLQEHMLLEMAEDDQRVVCLSRSNVHLLLDCIMANSGNIKVMVVAVGQS